jgi:hypothetical protein
MEAYKFAPLSAAPSRNLITSRDSVDVFWWRVSQGSKAKDSRNFSLLTEAKKNYSSALRGLEVVNSCDYNERNYCSPRRGKSLKPNQPENVD